MVQNRRKALLTGISFRTIAETHYRRNRAGQELLTMRYYGRNEKRLSA